jgi:hypothetical protein
MRAPALSLSVGRQTLVPVHTYPSRAARAGLVDEVEGSLGDAAEAAEPGRRRDLAQALLAGLGAQGQPGLLRQRMGHAPQGGGGIESPPDRGQVVLQPIAGIRLDQQEGPSGARVWRMWAAAPTGSPMSCRASKTVTRS